MNIDPRTVQMALRVVGAAALGLARVFEAVNNELAGRRPPKPPAPRPKHNPEDLRRIRVRK